MNRLLNQLCLKPVEAGADFIVSPHYHPETEWPLIVYTVSLQAAVGTLIGGLLWKQFGQAALENLLVTFVLGVIGLSGGAFHLASPFRAPRAILNWRCSWLSREILLSAAFIGFVALAALMYLLFGPVDTNSNPLNPATIGLRALAGLSGIVLLGAMGMAYLVPTRPAWNHRDTLAGFYVSAFQLGWALSAAMLFMRPHPLSAGNLALISGGLMMATLLRIFVVFRTVRRLRNINIYRDQALSWLTGNILSVRIVLAVAGGIAVPLCSEAVMLLSKGSNLVFVQGIWILAPLLLIAGEGIDRWVFFRASPAIIFPPRF